MAKKYRKKERELRHSRDTVIIAEESMTGWLFPLRPRQQSQSTDCPPPPPLVPGLGGKPQGGGVFLPPNFRITRGSELPESGSLKERSDEVALGCRMRKTTNLSCSITWMRVNPKCKLGAFRLDSPSRLQAVRMSA
jgi:hypothetical protein